jgi:L-asparaginase II
MLLILNNPPYFHPLYQLFMVITGPKEQFGGMDTTLYLATSAHKGEIVK